MRAVIYARFSSEMQSENSIDAQVRACREYADKNNMTVVKIYADYAKSARSDQREQFQNMIKDSERGIFDVLIVHKLDRFSRDRYDHAFYRRRLKLAGVSVCSVLEQLDGSPESVVLESVLEGFSEYYSRNLARETMKGLKEIARRCQHTGGTPPLGYDVGPDKHYIVNYKEAEAVRMIFSMYVTGYTYDTIVDELSRHEYRSKFNGPIGKNSIHDILCNEKYRGVYVFNTVSDKKGNRSRVESGDDVIKIEGGMPEIINQSLWEEVHRIMTSKKSGQRKATEPYLLSGIIFCGECGGAMVGGSRGEKKYKYYECNTHKRLHTCSMAGIPRDSVEELVISHLEGIFTSSNIDAIVEFTTSHSNEYVQKHRDKAGELNSNLAQLNRKINVLLEKIIGGLDSDAARQKLKDMETEKNSLEVQATEIEMKLNDTPPITPSFFKMYLTQIAQLRTANRTEQTAIIRQFVKKVVVYEKDDGNGRRIDIETTLDDLLRIPKEESSRNHKILFCIRN